MPGFVHIFRLGTEPQKYGKIVAQYQLNYTIGGNSYVRVFDENGLDKFLRSNIGITPEMTDTALQQLHEAGKTTLADVEIPQHEAPALGLEQVPTDY